MPKNKIDFMLGHAQSGVDYEYFKTDVSKLKELYKKFLPYLTFEKTIEVRSLDTKDAERLELLEKENQKLKDEMKGTERLKADMDEMKRTMELFKKAIAAGVINEADRVIKE